MTLTIELSPDIEAGLATLAAAQGLAVPDYVQHLIAEQIPVRKGSNLSIAERIAAWEDVHDIPLTPPLSDEAISRENMYGPRG